MFLFYTTTKKILPSPLSIKPNLPPKPTFQNPNPNPNPNLNPSPILRSSSYDHLISVAARSGDLHTIKTLLTQRIKHGFFNTTNTFNFLTENNPSTLSPTLRDVTKTLADLDPGFAQKHAFDALIAHLAKSRHTQHALQVLDEMLERAHGATPRTFYPLLSSLSKQNSTAELKKLISKMREHGVVPNVTCYNHVVSAHCYAGDVSAAADVVREMEGEGLVADLITYDALVVGACKVGRLDGAIGLVRRMECEGLKVRWRTYAHVIKGLLGLGFCDLGFDFVRVVGGGVNFRFLVRGLVRRKRWGEAKLVLREMECRALEIEENLRGVVSSREC